jgi:LacI family transcriptional regulator
MEMTMTRSVTIRDVARQAKVSVATVSRVISGSPVVAEVTRERVNGVLRELNFEPNRLGQALALKRHGAFALVLPGLGGPLFAGILDGFESTLQGTGITFHVLVAQNENLFPAQFKDLATRVDGMCIFGSYPGDSLISEVAARMPIVRVAGNPDPASHSVNVENFEAAHTLTTHLIDIHGLRDLIFVGDAARSPDVQRRYQGFQRALADSGVGSPDAIARCSLTQASGLAATTSILSQTTRPQGLVCATDEVAVGAFLACNVAGVVVPRDLTVTGFDNIELAGLITPALTTVNQPFQDIGSRAAQILLRHAHHKLPAAPAENHRFAIELVVRNSCGC